MEIVRKYVPIIVLTIILVIVWVGILLFSKKSLSTINPKA